MEYWQAYGILHSRRQFSDGPQPLQLQEIVAFLALEGRHIPKELVPKFCRLIRGMDTVYLDFWTERENAKARQARR